ncbi:MAG: tRNA pseudouridine(55) synthase TruB [Thermodesulfobacteriota bacterium]
MSCPAPLPAAETACRGIVLVDKPVGPSSFRMVQLVRRALGVRKVGHAGTLDPFASGLLVVAVGREATRLMPRLMAGDKEYLARVRLGQETDTGDHTGRVLAELPVPVLERPAVMAILAGFLGPGLQEPPSFSALKHQGRPLYAYARQGQTVPKEPRPVVIHELELVAMADVELELSVRCSKGTYIRTLARDLGRALGCGGHLTALRRLASGPFRVAAAVDGRALMAPEAPAVLRVSCLPIEQVLQRLDEDA